MDCRLFGSKPLHEPMLVHHPRYSVPFTWEEDVFIKFICTMRSNITLLKSFPYPSRASELKVSYKRVCQLNVLQLNPVIKLFNTDRYMTQQCRTRNIEKSSNTQKALQTSPSSDILLIKVPAQRIENCISYIYIYIYIPFSQCSSQHWMDHSSPFNAKTWVSRVNEINDMVVDALSTYVARSSTTMLLTASGKRILAFSWKKCTITLCTISVRRNDRKYKYILNFLKWIKHDIIPCIDKTERGWRKRTKSRDFWKVYC